MSLLIDILSNCINNNSVLDVKSDDIEGLMNEAEAHQLNCVVYDYLINSKEVSDDVLSKLYYYKLNVYQKMLTCKSRLSYSNKIFEVLNQEKIKYVLLKGLMFKVLYPNPDLRLMSDLDILVQPDELDKTVKLLVELGYKINEVKEHECNLYLSHPNAIAIELHHKLFSESVFGGNKYLENIIFNDRKSIVYENVKIFVPSCEAALCYAVLHMAKHFAVTGFGYRQLIDITLFMESKTNLINYEIVEQIFNQYDMLIFSGHIFELCNQFFKRNYFLFDCEIDDSKLEYMKVYISKSGVFGHRHLQNDVESEYLTRMQSRSGKLKNPIFAKLSLLFPKSKNMGDRYTYSRKYKFLLPIAWIHRITYNLIFSNVNASRLLKETPDSHLLNERLYVLKYFKLEKKFDE